MIHITHALGLNTEFIDFDAIEVPVHRVLLEPLQHLRQEAQQAGFRLGVCSGFRSFEQQLRIWNDKASGTRPLLDANGRSLDVKKLTPQEIVDSILLWSALPGASRHHWGSDVDVVDAEVVASGYRPQLTVEECSEGGRFFEFHRWLSAYLAMDNSDFFRPYTEQYDYGVSPEPWHLSYRPLAHAFSKVLSLESLHQQIVSSDLALKDVVLAKLGHIYRHYVQRYF